jgi:hypothetical protein
VFLRVYTKITSLEENEKYLYETDLLFRDSRFLCSNFALCCNDTFFHVVAFHPLSLYKIFRHESSVCYLLHFVN